MIKKRIIIAAVLAAVLVSGIVVYFAVIRRMPPQETPNAVQNETFLIFDRVGRENISSIEVHNESGDYTLKKRKLDDGSESASDFMLDGFDDLQLTDERVSQLVVAAGYPVAFQCVTDEATDGELAEYGFDEPQAYWVLTSSDGTKYKVEVGERLLSGGGYYGRWTDKPGSVYVISSNVESSILSPMASYVDPTLCYGVSSNDYYTADDLTVFKGDEKFVTIVQSKKEDFVNPDANIETHLEYPRTEKADDTAFNSVMYSLASLKGTETVWVGEFGAESEKEKYAEFGMDDPYYEVGFTYKNVNFIFLISSLQDDGYYYAASGIAYDEQIYGFSYIVRCEADSLSWLERDIDYWVNEYALQFSIGRVKSISLEYGERSMTFYLKHGTSEDGLATVQITNGEGFTIDDESSYIFKKFYITLLTMQSQGASGLTPEEIEELKGDEGSHMLTVTVTLDGEGSGETVYEYSFLRYTTGRALMTINGEGEYYVYPDWVEKTINDLDRLLNFEWIDPYASN